MTDYNFTKLIFVFRVPIEELKKFSIEQDDDDLDLDLDGVNIDDNIDTTVRKYFILKEHT